MNEIPHPGFDKQEEYETFTTTNDLEEAAGLWYKKCPFPKSTLWDEGEEMKLTDSRETFIAGAKWQKQHDAELIEIAYNDGITIGMTKQKEQMMKWAKQKQYESLTIVADNFWQDVIDKLNNL